MNHYVYKLQDPLGGFYYGSRSTKRNPEDDSYMGSGKWPIQCKKDGTWLRKTIIAKGFKTRGEASEFEIQMVVSHIDNELLQNISTTVQNPFMGERLHWNPFKMMLDSGFLTKNPLTVMLYIRIVAMEHGMGICLKVLARMERNTIEECGAALVGVNTDLPSDFPRITKEGEIYKATY